ncbi:MAG TPA: DNA polymerase IV, partial [Clostridia bacterium]|nr:DNA polymerase IV [Clostridia bacterium]
EIFSISKKLFLELWDGETPLRLLGLTLTNLSWGVLEQASFFNEARERERAVDKTIDKIRSKYGIDAISRCSLSKPTAKKSRQIQQAKRYED